MLGVLALALLLAVTLLPQLWVRHTISRHGKDRPDLPGTGGELARHLLDRFGMANVAVETTDIGDHYDVGSRTVRLLAQHHDGRSLSAVAIATHEVGHAIQHAHAERGLALRERLARIAMRIDRLATVFFIAAPVLGLLARHPVAFLGIVLIGVALLAFRVVLYAVMLPTEYDASFGKALPILMEGRYVGEADMPAIRSVLRAAALTYLAGALVTVINLARWLRVLR